MSPWTKLTKGPRKVDTQPLIWISVFSKALADVGIDLSTRSKIAHVRGREAGALILHGGA